MSKINSLVNQIIKEVEYIIKKVDFIENHLETIFKDVSIEFGLDYKLEVRDLFYETIDRIKKGENFIEVKKDILNRKGWSNIDVILELEELKYFVLNSLYFNIDARIFNISCEKLERMLIRIILLKEGWEGEKIESLLMRYYNYKIESEKIEIFYFCLRRLFLIDEEKKNEGRGRPRIPESIDKILKGIREGKNKERMRIRYTICNMLKKEITEDDMEKVITILKKEGESKLCEKMSKLLVYMKNG